MKVMENRDKSKIPNIQYSLFVFCQREIFYKFLTNSINSKLMSELVSGDIFCVLMQRKYDKF